MKYRLILLTVSLSFATQLTGCFTIRNYFDEMRYSRQIENRAEKVWDRSESAYRHVEHDLDDFGRGFEAGYVAVARGGDGCPPPMPPQHYWKTKYSNPRGKKKVVAWFDGYQHGAAAAIQDGMDSSRRIPTSGEIYNRCRSYVEYMPPEGGSMGPGEPLPFEMAPPPGPVGSPGVAAPELAPEADVVPLAPPKSPPYTPESEEDESASPPSTSEASSED